MGEGWGGGASSLGNFKRPGLQPWRPPPQPSPTRGEGVGSRGRETAHGEGGRGSDQEGRETAHGEGGRGSDQEGRETAHGEGGRGSDQAGSEAVRVGVDTARAGAEMLRAGKANGLSARPESFGRFAPSRSEGSLERLTGSRPVRTLVNLGFHLHARLRYAELAQTDPVRSQERTLRWFDSRRPARLGSAETTVSDAIRSVTDFQRAVPVRTYEARLGCVSASMLIPSSTT